MQKKILLKIFELSRKTKTIIQISYDSVSILLSFFLSLSIRLNDFSVILIDDNWLIIMLVLPTTIIIYVCFGFYQSIIRYVSEKFILTALFSIVISSLTIFLTSKLFNIFMPRSVPILYFSFLLIFTIGTRYILKHLFLFSNFDQRKNVAIYGAGNTGRNLLGYLNESLKYKAIIFLDDNQKLFNKKINGIKVYKFKNSIETLKQLNINLILLAMPNISQKIRQKIINELVEQKFAVKRIASDKDIFHNNKNITNFSNISIHDILEREEIPSISYLTKKNINNKVVLVTGAAGSIGSELCNQILINKPKILICLDNSEYSLYCLDTKIKSLTNENKLNTNIFFILGSVQDKVFLNSLFKKFKIDTIYHAAAYKHVPIVEKNIIEGIKNNIFGTQLISETAVLNEVKAFILISSDKAVRPTNYMGATKRVAELICQTFSESQTDTIFSIVRFGNVIGSSGSVIPLFETQVKNGGPVTLTHKEVTRYFMTTKEAVDLVIQAGAMSKNGDLFILEMGKPIKIITIAKKIIRLYGKEPIIKTAKNNNSLKSNFIEIKITGLRPGEKIFEELLIDDQTFPTSHPRIFKAREKSIEKKQLDKIIKELRKSVNNFDLKKIQLTLKSAPIDFNI